MKTYFLYSIGILLFTVTSCIKTVEQGYISPDQYSIFKINTMEDLNGVFMINEKTGFIVGDSGLVFKTTDGGIHWEKKYLGKFILNDVNFCDSLNGYIVGSNEYVTVIDNHYYYEPVRNYVFKTTNGGKDWTEIEIFGSSIDAKIYSLQKNKVVILSSNSIITYSDENSWTHYNFGYTTTDLDFSDLLVLQDSSILALGINGSIRTKDFFEHWDTLDLKSSDACILKNGKFLSLFEKSISISESGLSWDIIQNIDKIDDESNFEIDKMEGVDEKQFYIAVNGTINRTHDGGKNWKSILPREGVYKNINIITEFVYGIGSSRTVYLNKGAYQYFIKVNTKL